MLALSDKRFVVARSLFLLLAVASLLDAQVAVNPPSIDVTVTQDGPPPPPQQFSVVSTTGQPVAFRITGDGEPPSWLTHVEPEADQYKTPVTFRITLNQAGLKPGRYTLSASITDLDRKPLGVTITGVMTVVAPAPPKLEISPTSLRFEAKAGGTAAAAQNILLQNTGSGGLPPVGHTVANGSKWLTHFLTCQKDCNLAVTADPRGLAAGTYFDSIKLTTAAGAANVPVSFVVMPAVSGPLESRMAVDPGGAFFEAREGSGSGVSRDVSVIQLGDGPLSWTAEPVNAPDWLLLSSQGGTSERSKPSVFRISVNAASKSAGEYQGLVRITSSAPNSPLLFPVVLRVTPASTPPIPVLKPGGLVLRSGDYPLDKSS